MRAECLGEPPLAADDPPAVLLQFVAVRAARAQVLALAHERANFRVQLLDLGHGRNVAAECYEWVKTLYEKRRNRAPGVTRAATTRRATSQPATVTTPPAAASNRKWFPVATMTKSITAG
jgi:hypothetical protein